MHDTGLKFFCACSCDSTGGKSVSDFLFRAFFSFCQKTGNFLHFFAI